MNESKAKGPKYGVKIPGIFGVTFLFICVNPEAAIREKQEEYK